MRIKAYASGPAQDPLPVAPATTLVVPAGGSLQVTFSPPVGLAVVRLFVPGDVLEVTANAVGVAGTRCHAKVSPACPYENDSVIVSDLFLHNPGAADIVLQGNAEPQTGACYGWLLPE